MTRPALLPILALLLWPAVAGALPVTIEQTGRITSVEGPEPVGGVALDDPFTVTITYDSDGLSGVGEETLVFDGRLLVGPTFTLAVGTETYTELDVLGATSITFQDGVLVGYNYRLAEWNPPSGAEYFIFAEDGLLTQQFSTLPFGVEETRVSGFAPIPEPATALSFGLGLALVAALRRRR